MGTFPDSTCTWQLLGSAPDGRHSPIYHRDRSTVRPGVHMASVNAGDPGLYVGGGTLNAQFAREVPNPSAYAGIHRAALASARESPPSTTIKPADASTSPAGVLAVVAHLGAGDSGSGPPAAGTAFLDIFADDRPHAIAENAAMVYVVPPRGSSYADPDQFLAAISAAASRCVSVIATYNAAVGAELEGPLFRPLSIMRMCLFSGGQFTRSDTSGNAIAAANFEGVSRALAKRHTGLTLVEFESGAGELEALAG